MNIDKHTCHIDCQLIEREDGGRTHVMYPSDPTTAAGRYQYDRNREIYTMGKGARAAMRATGQSDTRTNREWNYGRKLFKSHGDRVEEAMELGIESPVAYADARYREEANEVFGPNRRPYVMRSIRSRARALRAYSQARRASIVRPAYLEGSEHDPNL